MFIGVLYKEGVFGRLSLIELETEFLVDFLSFGRGPAE